MDVKVYPGRLIGTVVAPPSKSMAHRALICASLTKGKSIISGISESEDMHATIGAMSALGAKILIYEGIAEVIGLFSVPQEERPGVPHCVNIGGVCNQETCPIKIDCIESGSTLRFVLPVAAAIGATSHFVGKGKLPERPMTPIIKEMKKKGIEFYPMGKDSLPFSIKGQLQPGVYEIPGNISSQYISGLLFALPLLEEDSEIIVTGITESIGYIDMTVNMLSKYGIAIEKTKTGYIIKGRQEYRPCNIVVEGDYSNAAFWLAANSMGSNIEVTGLDPSSAQGDKAILSELNSLGNRIDGRDIPDIVPIICVAAISHEGRTTVFNASRLRIKESDRLAAIADCLTRIGIKVMVTEDSITVFGGRADGGYVEGYNDHRIVMCMAIAALICKKPITINGFEAVNKSYPDFFNEMQRLGGKIEYL